MNLDALRGLETAIAKARREDLPAIVGELARLQALAWLSLSENGARPQQENSSTEGCLPRHLTARDVADMLGVSEKWCYDHADELGAVKLSVGCVRFPAKAVGRFLSRRKA